MIWQNTFRVGAFKCCLTFDSASQKLGSEWTPDVPKKFPPESREQYRAGRDALLAEVAKGLGKKIAVVEF